MEVGRKARLARIQRDTILFTGGLMGVLHETLLTDGERHSLLMLFAGMMGLPVFLRKDEADSKGDSAK
jgi:hypothetical protein